MDHSVKAMNNSHRKLLFSRLLNRHRFENDELEVLYQRYIFKLQHASVASVVGLFILLTGVLANLSIAYAQAPTAQNIYHGVHCLLFALLLAFLNTKLMQDAYLLWVCYAILFFCATFCAVSLPLAPDESLSTTLKIETKRVIAEGVWQVSVTASGNLFWRVSRQGPARRVASILVWISRQFFRNSFERLQKMKRPWALSDFAFVHE